jgi:hypothetical protein
MVITAEYNGRIDLDTHNRVLYSPKIVYGLDKKRSEIKKQKFYQPPAKTARDRTMVVKRFIESLKCLDSKMALLLFTAWHLM